MAKVFITAIPFLGKRTKDGVMQDVLAPVRYTPVGNPKLLYEEDTCFPIIPAFNGYTAEGDEVRVIAIITDGETSNAKNTKHNFSTYFEPEIKAVANAKKLAFDKIEVIFTPDSEDTDTQLKLFSDIVDAINPGDEIFACITYGTKPMPIVLTMALNYAHKLKKDASVVCTVYGRFTHTGNPDDKTFIYDMTPLFYMNTIVDKLAEIKASDPARAIKLMLGFETAEDI